MTDAELLARTVTHANARGWSGPMSLDWLHDFPSWPMNSKEWTADLWIKKHLAPAILFDIDFWKAIAGDAERIVCSCHGDDECEAHQVNGIPRYVWFVGECAKQPTLSERIRYAARVANVKGESDV